MRQVCKRLGLAGLESRHPASLSGGQKQRVTIGVALMKRSEIMVFDEPTSGLDGGNMLLIAEQLKNAVKNGKTVLVITHDEEFISKCCDYRLCVDEMKSMKK